MRWFYLVFFLAGMPALVYQVVWQRVLTLYFGVDIYSTTITISAFMLGLGLGSLAGGKLADRTTRPARWYVLCELLIGGYGVASLPLFTRVGETLAGSSPGWLFPVNLGLLLVPAFLMGMTLPLMCRIVTRSDATIGRQLAWLYGVNTLGASAGAIVAAYVLIGVYGLDGATWIAAGVNITLAVVVWGMAGGARALPQEPAAATNSPSPGSAPASLATREATGELSFGGVLAFSFLSGAVGLGYEIVWYRLLGCLLHGTVYVFGTILCLYLLGIAVGSVWSRRTIDAPGAARRFVGSQLGIAAYSLAFFVILGQGSMLPGLRHLIAASSYTSFHPSPDLLEGDFSLYNIYSLLHAPAWTVAFLGVPTLLMGYGFPNLMRAGSRSVASLGQSVSKIYFVNILGSTAGTLLFGFVLLDWWGVERALQVLVLLGCLPAAVMGGWAQREASPSRSRRRTLCLVAMAAGMLCFPVPGKIVRAIHYAASPAVDYVAASESKTGVVVLKRQNEIITFPEESRALGDYRIFIDGARHGGFPTLDSVEFDKGVPWALAACRKPRRALCIGLGDGKLCAAAIRHPRVEELVVVELSAGLRSVLEHSAQGRYVMESPKVRYFVDDGRRWLLANPEEKFDVIFMWPLHPAHAHSGSLFSHEFLTLLRSRLNSGGVVLVRNGDAYSTARTVATAFSHVIRSGTTEYLASSEPLAFDLRELGVTAEDFVRGLSADRETILAQTAAAPLVRDLAPCVEYYVTYPWRRFLTTHRTTEFEDPLYRTTSPDGFRHLILAP